jgi:carbon-monoxide dehydrogenase small subunit
VIQIGFEINGETVEREVDPRTLLVHFIRDALQCGYCTPGMLMSATYLLRNNPEPTEHEIRKAIQGNICRCTGYVNIVKAIQEATR